MLNIYVYVKQQQTSIYSDVQFGTFLPIKSSFIVHKGQRKYLKFSI